MRPSTAPDPTTATHAHTAADERGASRAMPPDLAILLEPARTAVVTSEVQNGIAETGLDPRPLPPQ
jgi:hypothetical protein